MGLGQFLNLVRAVHQWVVIELLGADGHHMQNNLGILRVIFVPGIVQRFSGASQRDRRDQFYLESGCP
jgi:hypothetical protein